MELFAALVVTRFRVGVDVDDLDQPFGILELHLLLVTLTGNLLLSFPLVGRRAITVRLLLLLLTKLLRELLNLPALLDVVAPGVVHWAPRPTLIAAEGLARSLTPCGPRPPPAAAATVVAVGAPASGLLLLLNFFFFLFLFLPLL
jgi:hypothetical protein